MAEFAQLKELRQQHPELFHRDIVTLHPKVLNFLGMTALPKDLPLGYIRLYPEDFIVEEVSRDGTIHTIEPETLPETLTAEDRRTLYCDVVKMGVGTADMQWRLANELNIDRSRVLYAGLKDEVAITSQLISLRGVRYEQIKDIKLPGIFCKNFYYGKDIIRVGSHAGNRFTILVRTERDIAAEDFNSAIQRVEQSGFLNYYGHQRFGYRPHRLGNRHSNHVLGKFICRGEYDQSLKTFLTATNDNEMPLFANIRLEAQKIYSDWPKLHELYSRYPVYFERELILVSHLIANPKDSLGALCMLEPQVKMWVQAYVSYCFNLLLSELSQKGTLPEKLPLPMSPDAADRAPYRSLFEQHGTLDIFKYIKPFPSIAIARHHIETKIKADIHSLTSVPKGVIVNFTLGKASYATTFLLNLFTLITDEPVPEWVDRDKIDIKATIGIGSVKAANEALGKSMAPLDM